MDIEWDPAKAKSNLAKHGVSFEEATTVFGFAMTVVYPDAVHSNGEPRFIAYGLSSSLRYLMVVYTARPGAYRIISARPMTKNERNSYEEKDFNR